jgi:hypothetical protein
MKPMIRWTLAWNNPRTDPPEGQQRVLLEQILPWGQKPEEIQKRHVLGSPYGIHFQSLDSKLPRRLSLESKQRIRRKSAIRRIEKAAPMFAASLIAETLNQQPDYYGDSEGKE